MVDFDLRQLPYFLAVARHLNISAAARELGMTQPALSRQVRAFENLIGSPLLERHQKSISLTRSGETMVRAGAAVMRSVGTGLKMRIEANPGMAFVAGTPDGLTTLKPKPKPAPLCIAMGSLKQRKFAEWEEAFVEAMKNAGVTSPAP